MEVLLLVNNLLEWIIRAMFYFAMGLVTLLLIVTVAYTFLKSSYEQQPLDQSEKKEGGEKDA